MTLGYTAGVFDLFHIVHVNMLKAAKSLCSKLIVGVTSDDLATYKNKKPIISFEDRKVVVESCRYVDAVIGQYNLDKFEAYKKIGFDIIFVGDDWYDKSQWKDLSEKIYPSKVIFLPYTKSTSSTLINKLIEKERDLLI